VRLGHDYLPNKIKNNMKNQVIKSLTSDHGKEIIAYWKSRDVDTCSCDGCYNEKDGDSCIYYGVINGKFRCYTLWEVIPTFAEIIELPKEPMKNQVIKVETKKHGKKVIAHWKSKGVETYGYAGAGTEKDGNTFIYYGVINRTFRCYSLQEVTEVKAEIIELPKLPKKEKLIKTVDSGNDFKIRICVKDEIRATLTDELIKVVNSQDKRIKVLEALVLKFIKKER
jgi:hypothetical protein